MSHSANNPSVFQKDEEKIAKVRIKYNPDACPECVGRLLERSGPYGRFKGCSK